MAQIVGALVVFLLVAVTPPAQGTMLLIPLAGLRQGQVTTLAIANGASVVQRGPLPASLVVYGDRARLLLPLAQAGVVTIAAGAVGCASAGREAAA